MLCVASCCTWRRDFWRSLAIAHSIIGEVRLIRSIAARDDLPTLYGTTRFTGATLRFAWHVTSVARTRAARP